MKSCLLAMLVSRVVTNGLDLLSLSCTLCKSIPVLDSTLEIFQHHTTFSQWMITHSHG